MSDSKKQRIKLNRKMNKMKYLLLLAICAIATGTMTSCLDSDDNSADYTFTQEELTTYLTRLSGTYQGKLMYYQRGRNKANTQDSLQLDSIENISWRINRDSTMTIVNFPDSIYNNAITGNSDFRKVLAQAPSKTMTCRYAPYKYRTMNNTIDYGFYTLPDGKAETTSIYTENKFTVDGKEYNVNYGYGSSGYFANSYYTSSGYQYSNGYIEIIYVINDIKCTDAQSFTTNTMPIALKGNKLY